jgi:methylated-DNA-protein-cysteine methyltransferase-like protein
MRSQRAHFFMANPSETYQRIYAVVARIPRGRVASYGQIARLADMPRHARLVGYALNALVASNRLPWHRVVNAQGRISERGDGGAAAQAQRKRLEKEGVRFSPQGLIDLAAYGWQPE